MMLKAWLIYDREMAEYNKHYITSYIAEGKNRNIDFQLLYSEDISFGIRNGSWYLLNKGTAIMCPDFVICRCIYPLLSKQLEYLNIKVYNNSFVSEICNDKAKTYQYVATTGIPMVDTMFCKNSILNDTLPTLDLDQVIKSVSGHGGNQVFHRDKINMDQDMIMKLGADDVVIQPFIGKKHQDLRVYVIGKEVVSAVLRTSKEGFRSNFSLGGEVRLYSLSNQEYEIVKKIIDLFDFGLVGIDFLIGDQGELIFNEIEDVVGSRMLYQCSNINIVSLYLDYILSITAYK